MTAGPSLPSVERAVELFAALPGVEAIAVGGSPAGRVADPDSDLDLYVYPRAELPLALRAELVGAPARRAELGNAFFEAGDEWVDEEVRAVLRTAGAG